MIEINSAVHTRFRCAARRAARHARRARPQGAAHERGASPAAARTRSRSGASAASTPPSASCRCRRNTASSPSSSRCSASTSTSAARAPTTPCTSTTRFSRYVPHFIALAASSPFYQGVDTAFDSSRLSVVNAFPLSGTMPWARDWEEFNAYYDRMHGLGIVQSMKDFYWDMRPKPEYGTVEIRVCDTPLTVDRAARDRRVRAGAGGLAVGRASRAVARHVPRAQLQPLPGVPPRPRRHAGRCRDRNERAAARRPARDAAHASRRMRSTLGSARCARGAAGEPSPATATTPAWLRARFAEAATLPDVVRQQAARFMG